MPDGLSFDELNRLYEEERGGSLRSMPYEQYFGEMNLSHEQIARRINTAKEIEKFTLYALMSMYYLHQEELYDYSEPISEFAQEYNSYLGKLSIPLTAFFAAMHVPTTATGIMTATLNHPDEMYYFSKDRATLIAENEANSIWNDAEFQDAILTGKTQKTWSAILDKATRDSHIEVNGTTIPIDEPFYVGDSLMMYPHDESMGAGPEEIVNCRCSVEYSGEADLPFELQIDNISIHRSVGAKGFNYDVLDFETGEKYSFAPGTRIRNSSVFAGKGTSVIYRNAYKYADKYGGEINAWQHCKGTGIIRTPDGDFKAEVHWSQCDGIGKYDFFIKRWLE